MQSLLQIFKPPIVASLYIALIVLSPLLLLPSTLIALWQEGRSYRRYTRHKKHYDAARHSLQLESGERRVL